MTWATRLRRPLLERALGLGLVTPAAAEAALLRLDAAERDHSPTALADILRAVGVPERFMPLLDPGVYVGRTVAGFRLGEPLGIGGMGFVFLARQHSLQRTVAVKILDPVLAQVDDVRERFQREAYAAAKLDHPHVVQPIDFGTCDGAVYFAMEHLSGGSVSDLLDAVGALAEPVALRVARDMARALVYAESQGLVHRDLKPANILFDAFGIAKLADLGLALDLDRDVSRLTGEQTILGSPNYLSPEQATGERDVDIRADIYGLGITLYEMLAGRAPFHGDTPQEVIAHQLGTELPDVRDAAPATSEATVALLERMTRKRRDERFPCAKALLEAIEGALEAFEEGAPKPRVAGATSRAAVGHPEASALDATGHRGDGDRSPTGLADADNPWIVSAPQKAPPPKPASAFRRPGALAIAALVLAALGAGVWIRLDVGRARRERSNRAAEKQVRSHLTLLLKARHLASGGFGSYVEGGDPWSGAEALRALVLQDDAAYAPQRLHLFEQIWSLAFVRDGRFAGLPYTPGADTVALLEGTADFGIALALAKGRVHHPELAAASREVFDYLLRVQNEDGSWSTLPAAGPEAATSSATAFALEAVVCLAAALDSPPGCGDSISRGSAALGRAYSPSRAGFRVRLGNPLHEPVAALNDRCRLALLQAKLWLERSGHPVDPSAEAALRSAAKAFAPFTGSVERVVLARSTDYAVGGLLQDEQRTTFRNFSWASYPWRLVVADAFAAADLPRHDDWAREAERVRGLAPALAQAMTERDAWQLAETLYGLSLVLAPQPPPGRTRLPLDRVRR